MLFFFFNDTATTEIYTLSLHDALPISGGDGDRVLGVRRDGGSRVRPTPDRCTRSLAGGAHRRPPPAGDDSRGRGEHRDRRGGAASGPGVRGLPLRDRGREDRKRVV